MSRRDRINMILGTFASMGGNDWALMGERFRLERQPDHMVDEEYEFFCSEDEGKLRWFYPIPVE